MRVSTLWACAPLVLASALVGQEFLPVNPVGDRAVDAPNPVPTRIVTGHYGTSAVAPLVVDCNLEGAITSTIRVGNGTPDAGCVLLCAARPDAIATPWGTLLVPLDAIPVFGVFDEDGAFQQPVDLANRELCGETAYFQAIEVGPQATLSWGFKVKFLPGNAQPELQYTGPPLEAVLCKAVSRFIPTLYSTLLHFDVPTHYQSLTVDSVMSSGGVTTVMAVLTRAAIPTAGTKPLRTVIDLGPFPTPRVEIMVADEKAGAGCLAFALAAVIDTRFPDENDFLIRGPVATGQLSPLGN